MAKQVDIYVGLIQTFGTAGEMAHILTLHRRDDGAYCPVEYPIDLPPMGRKARPVARDAFLANLKAAFPEKTIKGTVRLLTYRLALFDNAFVRGDRITDMHAIPLDENHVEGAPIFVQNDLISPQRLALYPALSLARACQRGDVYQARRVRSP